MERRKFIKSCSALCLGASAISVILEGCASTNYFAKMDLAENRIIVKKSEFIVGEGEKSKQRKYVLIKTEKLAFPLFLYKQNENEYSALLMYCPHKGCELQPQREYLVCPCHGSEFSNKGKVLNPPADQDLQQYKTSVDNEHIYIQLQ
jgi:cytochrome b6-f complex iron-sulfur subunit